MTSFMQDYGLHCTLYKDRKLEGIIKKSADDFIVTEIDLSGHYVTLEQTTPLVNDVIEEIQKETDESVDAVRSYDHDHTHLHAMVVLTDGQLQALQDLALKWEELASTESSPPSIIINLGCHSDKRIRSDIHKTVRERFPSLKTETRHNEQGLQEVIAYPNPVYCPLVQLLGVDEAKKLLQFINSPDDVGIHMLSPDHSKEHRTKVHRTLDELFGHTFESKTYIKPHPQRQKCPRLNEEDIKGPCIAIRLRNMKRKRKSSTSNIFTSFVMRKKNLETFEALHHLSKLLDCHPSQFTIAGLKDKRAITTQQVTVKNITIEQLVSDSSSIHHLVEIGNIQSVQKSLSLGDLSGNHFNITVHDLHVPNEENIETIIETAMASLNCNGFINYFGTQRFGNIPLSTPHIGLAMLQEDSEKAVKLFLQPTDSPDTVTEQAKKLFTTEGDIAGALSLMPSYKTRELQVLKVIKRYGFTKHGCHRALMSIPYQLRLMYVHSFCSLIWNHLASYRIQQYGTRPVVGDLIIVDENKSVSECVRPLVSHDITCGHYTIKDVVLPLAGSHVITPSNDVGTKFMELLAATGLTLASFKVLRKYDLSVLGSYRKLIGHVKDLKWKLVNETPPPTTSLGETKSNTSLDLEFSLNPSCYATTALREIVLL